MLLVLLLCYCCYGSCIVVIGVVSVEVVIGVVVGDVDGVVVVVVVIDVVGGC